MTKVLLGGSQLPASSDQLMKLNLATRLKKKPKRLLDTLVLTRMKMKRRLMESVMMRPMLGRRPSTGPDKARIQRG